MASQTALEVGEVKRLGEERREDLALVLDRGQDHPGQRKDRNERQQGCSGIFGHVARNPGDPMPAVDFGRGDTLCSG